MAQINYLYANNTYIESQVAGADAVFKDLIGYVPDIFQPSSRALDTRGQKILKDNGKTIVTWSAGANGWWFLDNGKSLEETVAALRYTLPEAGGMIQMPNDAEVLEEYFDQVWQYWNFVDFETCTARSAKGSKSSKVMAKKSANADSSKGAKEASSKAEKTADMMPRQGRFLSK